MKTMLKPPGTQLLKLTYYGPPSSFDFNFNLRRYSKGCEPVSGACTAKSGVGESCGTSSDCFQGR